MLPVADNILQEQAKRVLKRSPRIRDHYGSRFLQSYIRYATVQFFIEWYEWKIAGRKNFFANLHRTTFAGRWWKLHPLNVWLQELQAVMATCFEQTTSWSHIRIESWCQKKKSWCLTHLRHFPVIEWYKSLVFRVLQQGKIDCKKGDLRRHRCSWFAWLRE